MAPQILHFFGTSPRAPTSFLLSKQCMQRKACWTKEIEDFLMSFWPGKRFTEAEFIRSSLFCLTHMGTRARVYVTEY